jgi:hypothetical protein
MKTRSRVQCSMLPASSPLASAFCAWTQAASKMCELCMLYYVCCVLYVWCVVCVVLLIDYLLSYILNVSVIVLSSVVCIGHARQSVQNVHRLSLQLNTADNQTTTPNSIKHNTTEQLKKRKNTRFRAT